MKKMIFIVIVTLLIVFNSFSDDLGIDENMVFVEGGEFLLGNEKKTLHLVRVRLDSYYISKYETTVEQWENFLKETETPYLWKDEYTDVREESPYPTCPIQVKWMQAVLYSNWVSRKYGLEECYIIDGENVSWKRKANGYRLPTDAEWEFAAKGGNLSKGYEYSGSNNLEEVAWTGFKRDSTTHPVGTKKPNELGLYDMSGNMDERCWDLSLPYPNDPNLLLVNPTGPTIEEYLKVKKELYRITRDGSAKTSDEIFFKPYFRSGSYQLGTGANGSGIRLARNASDK